MNKITINTHYIDPFDPHAEATACGLAIGESVNAVWAQRDGTPDQRVNCSRCTELAPKLAGPAMV